MKKHLLLPALVLVIAACQKNTPELTAEKTISSIKSNKKVSSLVTVPFRTDSVYGATVHFGQLNNQDYPASKIGFAMQLSKIMNFYYLRCDVTMSNAGAPSNPAFEPFADSCYNNNIGIFAVINNPSLNGPANNSGYTSSELSTFYQRGYDQGYGFISRSRLQGKIQFVQIFNELENYDPAGMLIPTYSGTQEPAANQNDSVKYNMTKYPAYLQFMLGAYTGIKAANPGVKVGTNYSWIHYGLFLRFSKDMLAQNKKLDFMLINWYNTEEYAIDKTHNVYQVDTAMKGQAINRLKYKFLTQPSAPLVNQVGMSETGISFGQLPTPNPNNLSKGSFLKLMHDQYKPQSNILFYYELFKEPQARASNPREAQFGIQIATNPANHLVTDTLSLLH